LAIGFTFNKKTINQKGAMNLIITLMLVTSSIVLGVFMKNRNSKRKQDKYNDFHLGEMTRHDIPGKIIPKAQDKTKWSSRESKNKEGLKSLKK